MNVRCCSIQVDDHLSPAAWEQRYQDKKTGWDRGEANPQLATWLSSVVEPGMSVLVPGSGRGHEVLALAEAGAKVTAIDFADSAIQELRLRQQQTGLMFEIVHSDLFAYSPGREFDVIYEQTCLCAIHPTQWKTYEQLLNTWLRADGHLLALFMQSHAADGPPFHCDMETMRSLFHSDRWHWGEAGTSVPHPTGMMEIAFHLRCKG